MRDLEFIEPEEGMEDFVQPELGGGTQVPHSQIERPFQDVKETVNDVMRRFRRSVFPTVDILPDFIHNICATRTGVRGHRSRVSVAEIPLEDIERSALLTQEFLEDLEELRVWCVESLVLKLKAHIQSGYASLLFAAGTLVEAHRVSLIWFDHVEVSSKSLCL